MTEIQPIASFFPENQEEPWRFSFTQGDSLKEIIITFKSHKEGDRRIIELNSPADFKYVGFYDRWVLSPVGLELHRARLKSPDIVNIAPPLIVTADLTQVDKVNVLLPANTVVGTAGQPIPGQVRYKSQTKREVPGSPIPIWDWKFTVAAIPLQYWPAVFTAKFTFSSGVGLTEYSGDVFGNYFKFTRLFATNPGQPPLPPQPPHTVVATQLLGLSSSTTRIFKVRNISETQSQLLCRVDNQGLVSYEGAMKILFKRLIKDNSGVKLLEIQLWNQKLVLDKPLLIAPPNLNLDVPFKFEWTAPANSITAPGNIPVQKLYVKGFWFNYFSWAQDIFKGPPGNPFADFSIRTLALEARGITANGAEVLYQEVLALHETIGPIRAAIHDSAVNLFDIFQYPGPLT